MRFGVSHVLDAIERRISIDPTAAGGVVDLGEVVRFVDLDGGRPAHLLRLGLVIDALAQHLSDGAVAIYAVADRSLMSDTDITANERMVIRRWSDDGKIEVVRTGGPAATLRIREIAALTGLPLLTRNPGGYPGPSYAPVAGQTGPVLATHHIGTGPAAPAKVFSRSWRCSERICASFGTPGMREPDPFGPPPEEEPREVMSQPPPQLINGVPHCPRHGTPLQDFGPRPRAVALSIRVKGVAWHRFVVTEADPVVVGRAPEEEDGVGIGLALDEQGLRWVSRSHVRLELRGHTVQAVDLSTNGTSVLRRTGPGEQSHRTALNRGESAQVGEWDTVELYESVEIGRADRGTGPVAGAPINSVMAEAATQAMRLS